MTKKKKESNRSKKAPAATISANEVAKLLIQAVDDGEDISSSYFLLILFHGVRVSEPPYDPACIVQCATNRGKTHDFFALTTRPRMQLITFNPLAGIGPY